MVVDLTGRPGPSYARIAFSLLSRRRGTSPPGRTVLPDRTVIRREAVIDRGHLARYDRVCGFRLGDALPATYPHVLAAPLAMRLMTDPDFPFPVAGLVHVANRITVHRPIHAGSRLDLSVRAAGLRPHDRGQQFDVISSAAVDGEEVWHGVSTYLRKERPGGDGGRGDHPPGPAATARWHVPVRVGRDYAAVSGDHNPIHTSRLGAYLFGFPRPIAHGMWSKARCLAALDARLPAAYRVDVTFKLPILLPAIVGFAATQTAGGGWDFTLRAAESGRPHLAGSVTGT